MFLEPLKNYLAKRLYIQAIKYPANQLLIVKETIPKIVCPAFIWSPPSGTISSRLNPCAQLFQKATNEFWLIDAQITQIKKPRKANTANELARAIGFIYFHLLILIFVPFQKFL